MTTNINSNTQLETPHNTRISELDLLRGFALCGIFFLNIISMGYLIEAYSNPTAFIVSDISQSNTTWLDGSFINNLMFIFTHLFIDQKMMGLFSMLFGASAMLFLSSLKIKNQSAAFYFKRNIWLFIFGLLHGTFLFSGDILFIYSICALLLFPFSKLRPKLQIFIGTFVYCLPIYLQLNFQLSINDFSSNQIQELVQLWKPDIETIQAAVEFERNASYLTWIFPPSLWDNYGDVFSMYSNSLLIEGFARSFGLMLIGMALLTLGVLPNHNKRKPIEFYRKTFHRCAIFGLLIIGAGLSLNYYHEWSSAYSAVGGRILNHIGAPLISCAYLSVAVIWVNKSSSPPLLNKLKYGLQAIGRMALTNYVMQSVIGLILFTQIGFSLYAQLNRFELMLIVLGTCLFQLYFSIFWLRHFKYGPLEWLWRSLTFTKLIKKR